MRGSFDINTKKCSLCQEELCLQQKIGAWQYLDSPLLETTLFDCRCCYPFDIIELKHYHNICAKSIFEMCKDHPTNQIEESPHDGLFYETYCMVKKTCKTKSANKKMIYLIRISIT